MKRLLAMMVAALLFAGCATVTAPTTGATAKKELTEPEMAKLTDPNPYANYEPAMANSSEFPLTVNWQDAHKGEIAAATDPETLAKCLATDEAAARLLDRVGFAYKTDPIVMIQIGAVTQLVMDPKCAAAPKFRERWTKALLEALDRAPDAYRMLFYLDQLRWCGYPEQAQRVRTYAKWSKVHVKQKDLGQGRIRVVPQPQTDEEKEISRHVREFAALVEAELAK